jgi:hypothetical protein
VARPGARQTGTSTQVAVAKNIYKNSKIFSGFAGFGGYRREIDGNAENSGYRRKVAC